MDVDIDRFTLILADRLAAIVPAGFSVTAHDGMLWYSAMPGKFPGQQGDYRVGGSGTYVRDNFGVHGETAEEQLAGPAAQALDELQDFVDEATHDPWPGNRTPPQARAAGPRRDPRAGTASLVRRVRVGNGRGPCVRANTASRPSARNPMTALTQTSQKFSLEDSRNADGFRDLSLHH